MNAKIEKITEVVGTYIPGEMKMYTSTDTVESEDENALGYTMEMLNILSQRSDLPNHQGNLKKVYIVIVPRNFGPKNGHLNGPT